MAGEQLSSNPKKRNLQIIRSVFVVLVVCLVFILFIKYFGNSVMSNLPSSTTPKNTIQLKYQPAEYEIPVNEGDATAILENPVRYRREFNETVYEINTSMLNHISKRMGLSESQRSAVIREYKNNFHREFASLYFNDFVRLKDTTSTLYETWYNNKSATAVDIFHEISSKYTCFLAQQVLANVIQTEGKVIKGKGRTFDTPCGIALNEALIPLINKMKDRAAINDFSRSKGLFQEKVEKAIAELATYEIDDKKGISSHQSTKFLGLNVSTSDIEVSAISKIKAGFNINQYFNLELDERTNIVTITLPQPTILSHEVYPRFDKLDIGWMREVEDEDFNVMINALRTEFKREALEKDQILDKAKSRAVEIMNTMFAPLVSSFNEKYKLKVEFRKDEIESNPELPDINANTLKKDQFVN